MNVDPKFKSIINIAAVTAFAVAAALQLGWSAINIFAPSTMGDFGLYVGNYWEVLGVEPNSPAAKAHIAAGDRLGRPLLVRDRLLLTSTARPGERVRLLVEHQGTHRFVTLQAQPSPARPLPTVIFQVLGFIAMLIFMGAAATLVLLRPSKMTWAFYLTSVGAQGLSTASPWFATTNWYVAYTFIWDVVILPACFVGLLVFFLRFPGDVARGWRGTIDRFAPLLFVVYAAGGYYSSLVELFDFKPAAFNDWWQHVFDFVLLGVGGIILVSVLTAYFKGSGVERHRVQWVVLGTACLFVSVVLMVLPLENIGPLDNTLMWAMSEIFLGVLPLTVLYAVIRHHVIDVRFVLSRALVFGTIAVILGVLIVALDWLFSTRFTSSRWQTAAYAGIALLVGLSLNGARQRIEKLIDSLLFHKWYRTRQQAGVVGDAIIRATSRTDLYEPLTAGVTRAFSLASAALFERAADGGFVRVAAQGWPPGTLWHVLPHDKLSRSAVESGRARRVDALTWGELEVPSGAAQPLMMVPVVSGKAVVAVALLSAHDDGTGLDPDEIRALRALYAKAASAYQWSAVSDSERLSRSDASSEPSVAHAPAS